MESTLECRICDSCSCRDTLCQQMMVKDKVEQTAKIVVSCRILADHNYNFPLDCIDSITSTAVFKP